MLKPTENISVPNELRIFKFEGPTENSTGILPWSRSRVFAGTRETGPHKLSSKQFQTI